MNRIKIICPTERDKEYVLLALSNSHCCALDNDSECETYVCCRDCLLDNIEWRISNEKRRD